MRRGRCWSHYSHTLFSQKGQPRTLLLLIMIEMVVCLFGGRHLRNIAWNEIPKPIVCSDEGTPDTRHPFSSRLRKCPTLCILSLLFIAGIIAASFLGFFVAAFGLAFAMTSFFKLYHARQRMTAWYSKTNGTTVDASVVDRSEVVDPITHKVTYSVRVSYRDPANPGALLEKTYDKVEHGARTLYEQSLRGGDHIKLVFNKNHPGNAIPSQIADRKLRDMRLSHYCIHPLVCVLGFATHIMATI